MSKQDPDRGCFDSFEDTDWCPGEVGFPVFPVKLATGVISCQDFAVSFEWQTVV